MRRRARARRTACASLLLACAACGKPEPVTWDKIQFQELLDAMASPTGRVTNESVLEIANVFVENAEAIVFLGKMLDRMFPTGLAEALENPDGTPLAPDGGWGPRPLLAGDPALGVAAASGDDISLEGTNVFVKIACWGPDALDPDLSFAHGYIRVDGPGLTSSVIEEFDYTGHFLLSYEGCEFPTGTLEGANAGFYETTDTSRTVAFRLATIVTVDGVITNFLDERVMIRNGVFSILYKLQDGSGTLRVDSTSDYASFSITGENGRFGCAFVDGDTECVAES